MSDTIVKHSYGNHTSVTCVTTVVSRWYVTLWADIPHAKWAFIAINDSSVKHSRKFHMHKINGHLQQ